MNDLQDFSFRAPLHRSDRPGSTSFLTVPPEIIAAFAPRRRVPVAVTLNGHQWRSTIAVYGAECMIPVALEHRTAAGVAEGETVEARIRLDETPRTLDLPPDLMAALATAGAAERFQSLAFSHRKEYVQWIEGAKQPETRQRRIAGTIERLTAGKRLK